MFSFIKKIFFRKDFSHYVKDYHRNFKSDKRLPGGKNGICVLCNSNQQLRLSHIVPKWCYQWCKEEGNGTFNGNYRSINIQTKEQDGSKHYLLCGSCEQYLGDAERYVRTLMHGSDEEKQNLGISETNLNYAGLNFQLIQRFLFGIALKSHFATSAPFHSKSLHDNDVDILRDRILSPTEDDLELVIVAMQFYSEDPEIDPRAMMIPHQINKKRFRSLSFLIAGWEWILIFNEKGSSVNPQFINIRLRNTGEMRIPTGNILDHRLINAMFRLKRYF